MQLFKRRRITITTLEEDDVLDYYLQFNNLSEELRSQRGKSVKQVIRRNKNSNNMFIFSVKEAQSEKMIGTVLVKRIGMYNYSLQVSIPNQQKSIAYGTEVIDQFIKICKEEEFFKDFKMLKLDIKD